MRLIDADKLVEFLKKAGKFLKIEQEHKRACHVIGKIIDYINAMPTIDAVEVVHGHWKRKPHWCVACSYCGKYTQDYDGEVELYNYCPNCGAKMDEEVNE